MALLNEILGSMSVDEGDFSWEWGFICPGFKAFLAETGRNEYFLC